MGTRIGGQESIKGSYRVGGRDGLAGSNYTQSGPA